MDGQTRVKTLPSRRTTYAGGNKQRKVLFSLAFGALKLKSAYDGYDGLVNGHFLISDERTEVIYGKCGQR